MLAEGRACNDQEAVDLETRDGEVALDAAARVEHGGIDDAPRRLVDIVVAKILQEGDGPVTAHLDLAERGLIEQPRALARAEMLDADGRRPVVSRPA